MTLVLSLELVQTYRVLFFRLSMRCVVFELAGGGTYVPPPGRAKVAQTPGRARVKTPLEISGSYRSICKIQTAFVSPQHDLHF